MNCHTFSTGLSSGHLGGSAMMVMLAGNDQACRHVPAGLVDQEDSVGGGCNGRGDLRKVQVHRFGIAGRQDQGCALAPLRTYRITISGTRYYVSFSSALAASTSLARVVAPFPTGARRCGPTCGPRPRARRLLLLRFSVWVNQISRFGICGPDYWLHFAIAELIEIVRLHVLELRPDLARFRPFAVAREAEAAAYGVELRLVHVCRELVVIQALRFR